MKKILRWSEGRGWAWRLVGLAAVLILGRASQLAATPVTFVFTSDVHYGITRGSFRGAGNVESRVVDAALVAKINRLPTAVLPKDDGLRAGEVVGPIEFSVITGDIANRQELYPIHVQSATVSWAQFEETILKPYALKNAAGETAPLFLVPGNHDVSDAIGSPSKMVPERDATSMAEIYNHMLRPAVPLTKDTYDYAKHKIYYSRDFGGAHCIFLTMWPDSTARAWIDNDLARVAAATPVFLFCHDQPDLEAKHLTNPNGKRDINSHDKFENVVGDVCADGTTVDVETAIEQRALVAWLKTHRNITGYFHGNSNWHQVYTWTGLEGDLALNTFRADSSMKGKDSGKDEKRLSFQLITFDVAAQTLTSRECLWNAKGKSDTDDTPVGWGESHTLSIAPRAK